MLPKNKRLNLKKDFSRVIKGRRIETSHFILYFVTAVLEMPRVGISIRSKNFGKAHNRNRARRLTSQVIQNMYDNLPKTVDLIIMPKSAVLDSSREQMEEEVKNVFDRH